MFTSKKTKSNAGFTLTEMVIVIAVIAILAAVLIPTFIGVSNRAKLSADTQTAANATTAAKTITSTAPQDVWNAVAAEGIDLTKTQSSNYRFAYAVKGDTIKSIVLLNDKLEIVENEQVSGAADVNLWFFVKNSKDIISASQLDGKAYTANYFLTQSYTGSLEIGTLASFDTGSSTLTGGVYYGSQSALVAGTSTVNVSGNINGTLFINAPSATFNQNGTVTTLTVWAVAGNSLHVNGTVKNLSITKGRLEVASNAVVQKVIIPATAVNNVVQVVNNGYITKFAVAKDVETAMQSAGTVLVVTNNAAIENAVVENASTGTEEAITNPELADEVENDPGYQYSIGTLAQLEAFRDAVNNGSTFKDIEVTLTADIVLTAGWTPIGSHVTRKDVQRNGKDTFMGTFNGNNHKISNLTNTGYIPTAVFRNDSTFGSDEYSYGLFATVKNATIRNLTVEGNINIPTAAGTLSGEQVGIIVGAASGTLTMENCVAKGSIYAYNNVAGLVGAAYSILTNGVVTTPVQVAISNCVNYATVSAESKCAGIIGYVPLTTANVFIVETINYGNITARNTVDANAPAVAAGFVTYGTDAATSASANVTLYNVSNYGIVSSSATVSVPVSVSAFTVSWIKNNNAGFEGRTQFTGTYKYTQQVSLNGVAQNSRIDDVAGGSVLEPVPAN